MRKRILARTGVVIVLTLAAWFFTASILPAEPQDEEMFKTADRYLTHLATDKPVYRPGEMLYVRGAVLNCRDNTPLKKNLQVYPLIEIKGPKGETLASGYASVNDSIVAFSWKVPASASGGEYKVKVKYYTPALAPAERKFDIRAYRVPRLRSQIIFARDGYGPGDRVTAALHTERAEGGIPSGAKVAVIARVDGAEVYRGITTVDPKGNCGASFNLPRDIARGEGSIAFVIEDGGVVETAAKTIPILLQTVDLGIYPEGGELVAGLPSRVYIEGRTPAKKPADIAGVVVDGEGVEVAKFRTEHEGRGRFEFTPEKGKSYQLKITEPSGIKTRFALPQTRESGAVIRSTADTCGKGEPVKLRVGATSGEKLKVTLSKREQEVAVKTVEAQAGKLVDVELAPPSGTCGVLMATVWDKDGKPLAERLVFKEPEHSVHISIEPDRTKYVPGGKVSVKIRTTDESGKPVSAVVGVAITDDSVLEMIEKREQAPRLPVMVFFESDVKELADAHVYLDEENPKAPLAVDLLLGTQGWRRFAFVEPKDFLSKHKAMARRVLALGYEARPEAPMTAGGMRWGRGKGAPEGAAPEEKEADGVKGKPAEVPHEAPPERVVVAKDKPAPEPVAQPAKPADKIAQRERLARAAEEEAPGPLPEMAKKEKKMGELRLRRRRQSFAYVRVYAHKVRPDRRPGDRMDFAETLYWNAGIRTNAETGEAEFAFGLSDSVTTFRVFADAFSDTGALGQGTGAVESVEPFYAEPKMPLEVTQGDIIRLPIAVVNGTGQALRDVRIEAKTAKGIKLGDLSQMELAPNERGRAILDVRVGKYIGEADVTIQAGAGGYSDRVTRTLKVTPLGFPVEAGFGGMINPGETIRKEITIPEELVRGSVRAEIAIYPTPLANLTQALARLMREPYGCFEQTSSTTYPTVMAKQYFESHHGVDPKIIERAQVLIDKGYKRLVSFECHKKGYEWFGKDPGHEALTAYGLMEFTDMSTVYNVDTEMLANTREWLLAARDGKGGFTRKRRALHTWILDKDCSDGYITWALLECGVKGIDKEAETFVARAASSKNSYVLALAANVAALTGSSAEAKKFMDRLAKAQDKEGYVDGGTTTIVGSGGIALDIETTSLAVLAWLRDEAYAASIEKAIGWICECCKGGRFGSTQSTVLALRAIIAYDKSRATPKAPGRARLVIDGHASGGWFEFDEKTTGAIKFPDIGEVLEPGRHTIELRMEGGSRMPYSITANYHTLKPQSSNECKLSLSVSLADSKVNEGEVTEVNVSVANTGKEPVPTSVAIIGIPGGLEPRHDQLKELVKADKIAAYEVIGRDVVLYWRELKGGKSVKLPISLVAAVPGTYTGPASRTYLYYTDEYKCWADGLKVQIKPRGK